MCSEACPKKLYISVNSRRDFAPHGTRKTQVDPYTLVETVIGPTSYPRLRLNRFVGTLFHLYMYICVVRIESKNWTLQAVLLKGVTRSNKFIISSSIIISCIGTTKLLGKRRSVCTRNSVLKGCMRRNKVSMIPQAVALFQFGARMLQRAMPSRFGKCWDCNMLYLKRLC